MNEESKGIIKSTKKGRAVKKTNLTKFYNEMSKNVDDAVDKEVLKRFKTIIDSSDDDMSKVMLDKLLKNPEDVDFHSYHEQLQPYLKHYLFMLKRSKKKQVS